MNARILIEVDPGCGTGSSCRLIDSSDRNFPSESSQFGLTRPTRLDKILRNFRPLWGAGALSAIGNQFDLIAFPWLVLMVTGDPLAGGGHCGCWTPQ